MNVYVLLLILYIRLIKLSPNVAVLEYEQVYMDNLPCCECYEKSYMHRDVITHILVTKLVYIATFINSFFVVWVDNYNLFLCDNTDQILW